LAKRVITSNLAMSIEKEDRANVHDVGVFRTPERDYEEADDIGQGIEERYGEIGRCQCRKMAASSNATCAAKSMKWNNRLGLYGVPPTSCFPSD
jgi:hypothetical protein